MPTSNCPKCSAEHFRVPSVPAGRPWVCANGCGTWHMREAIDTLGNVERIYYNIEDRQSQHNEDLSPVSGQLVHIAEVVLGQWGEHFSAGFSELRGRAAGRQRTDAYNLLIEAERLVIRWIRDKDSRITWLHRNTEPTWQPPPDRPNMARRGRPPKESAQSDIVDVEFTGTVPASVKREED